MFQRQRGGEGERGADLGRYEIMTKNNRNIAEIKEGKIERNKTTFIQQNHPEIIFK